MRYKGNDIYCDLILKNKIQIKKIKETDNVLAFYHTNPSYKIHIVVVPKTHIDSILTLKNNKVFLELMRTIKEITKNINSKYRSARIITNTGNYQDSKHLHFHIVYGGK